TSVPVGATIILGMVAYFSGVTQAPITAFVIVMEMRDNHEMILPLMAAAFIAKVCSRLVCPTPLFLTMSKNFISKQSPSKPRTPGQDDGDKTGGYPYW
ncbi:MAG: chloride channel protein, partial [Gammaproteobacteria bacterium]|nr:chloride channel protein [Gammaproteobacteria bacterium]